MSSEKKLLNDSGIEIKPVYTHADVPDAAIPRPGDFQSSSNKPKQGVRVKKYYRIQFSLDQNFSKHQKKHCDRSPD